MNIVENFLLHQLDLRLQNRQFAQELIEKHQYSCDQMVALLKQVSGRQKVTLLCLCDTYSRTNLVYFANDFQFFIDLATDENHETNKRSLTNMYIAMLKTKQLTASQKERLTEIGFAWLIDESLVATKSNCITCLDLLSRYYPWINDELLPIIEQIYPVMSVSFQSRARKIMQRKRKK